MQFTAEKVGYVHLLYVSYFGSKEKFIFFDFVGQRRSSITSARTRANRNPVVTPRPPCSRTCEQVKHGVVPALCAAHPLHSYVAIAIVGRHHAELPAAGLYTLVCEEVLLDEAQCAV